MKCFVHTCSNNRKEHSSLSFHRLPSSPGKKLEWLTKIGRNPNDNYSNRNVICSEHFTPDDFIVRKKQCTLKKSSIPSQKLPMGTVLGSKGKHHYADFDVKLPMELPSCTATTTSMSEAAEVKAIEALKLSPPVAPSFHLSQESSTSSTGTNVTLSPRNESIEIEARTIPSLEITVPFDSEKPLLSSSSSSYPSPVIKRKRTRMIQNLDYLDARILKSSSESDVSVTTRQRKKVIKMIHNYSHSPAHSRKEMILARQQSRKLKSVLYNKKRTITRLRRKISNLKEILNNLKRKDLVSTEACSSIEKSITGIPSSIIRRFILNSRKTKPSRMKYPPELRSFALTLHFYSSKAYDYVRKTFELCLPAPSIIRSWYFNIDCSPGYCTQAFELIRQKVNQSEHQILCALMLDEMSIRKKVEVIGSKVYGYIDMGTGLESDTLCEATNALVYMAVGVNSNWKIPIAYFLINSLTGREKANIVRESIIKLSEIGVTVISVTCDGPATHFSMMSELGCDIKDVEKMKPWFTHPSNPDEMVFFILDACHMLKLVRNCLHKLQVIKNEKGEEISWKYIELLYKIQDFEHLSLGCKLSKQHIEWQRQKMKVKLAAQTLSRSTADALEYLSKDEKRKGFEGAGPTIEFIRLIDAVFDLLNSRNPFAKGSKSALRTPGEPYFRPLLENALKYLSKCTDVSGRNILQTNRKTPFIGFLISIRSVLGIYDKYVKPDQAALKYLLTYKLSQDHLELYFCWVRSRNGFNNNPSAFQFINTFKRLLLHHDIKTVSGNCVPIDATSILNISSAYKTNVVDLVNTSDINMLRRYNIDYTSLRELDIPNIEYNPLLTDYVKNVVNYIAGFVVKMAQKKIHCVTCLDALVCHQEAVDDTYMALFTRKNKGGLIRATKSVKIICQMWEIYIRHMMNATDNKVPPENSYQPLLENFISNALIQKPAIFPSLQDHFDNISLDEEPHKKNLLKLVGLCYCRIRMFHLARRHTDCITGPQCRQLLSKLVLFRHQ